jgi:DNA-binding MarR family transcriptional regulator
MPRKPKAHTREAGAALAAAAPLASRWVERVLASHEPPFTVAQYLALRAIDRTPLSAADLARRAGVSGPAVSQLLSTLDAAGLVERRQAESDRRTQGLALTPYGVQMLESTTSLVAERLGDLLADMPRPEADALTRLLERVEAALAGTAPPRRPPPPRPAGGPPKPPRRPR